MSPFVNLGGARRRPIGVCSNHATGHVRQPLSGAPLLQNIAMSSPFCCADTGPPLGCVADAGFFERPVPNRSISSHTYCMPAYSMVVDEPMGLTLCSAGTSRDSSGQSRMRLAGETWRHPTMSQPRAHRTGRLIERPNANRSINSVERSAALWYLYLSQRRF
jgi:hypothetical protein